MAGPQPSGRAGEHIAGIISEGLTGSGIPVTHFRGCRPVFGSAVAELKKPLLARNRSSYGNGSSPSRLQNAVGQRLGLYSVDPLRLPRLGALLAFA